MKKWFILLFVGVFAASPLLAEEGGEAVAPGEVPADIEIPETEPAGETPVLAEDKPVDAEESQDVAPKHLPVALWAVGDVDDALMERVQKWAQEKLAIPVPVLDAAPNLQIGTFDEVAQQAELVMESNRIGIVVIWRPNSDINNHGVHYPERRVAIANLNPMFTEGTDPEKIERRVERQVIRGICHVMGLEPSPNPLSAMFSYSNLEELDQIGRNLDLPWLVKLQEKAIEKGIPVDPDSAYNVVQ